MPKISIIMSVYNSEKFLDESILSILEQTFTDFEFIIIDDSSTDKSKDIIQKYAKEDKRVNFIQNKENKGLTKNLNKGLKIAKGKYIARIDADDVADKHRLQIQYDFLEKNKDIYLAGTGAYKINGKSKIIGKYSPILDSKKINKTLSKNNCIYHPSIMFRNTKDLFYRDKFTYSQDYDLYLNMITKNKKLVNIKDKLIYYRKNINNISNLKKTQQDLFAEKAREFYIQRKNTEKDDYKSWDHYEILNLDIENSENKKIILSQIKMKFRNKDYDKSTEFCKKYMKLYGWNKKVIIYFLVNKSPTCIKNLFKTIVYK